MKFTDIFIKRPVLATVVSLLILVAGIGSYAKLSLRQYPKMTNTVITVTTAYPGATAETMRGFVTTPLQRSIASADGIDQMTSTSSKGVSVITAKIKLNFDPDSALTEITGKVSAVMSQLPQGIQSPVIAKSTGNNMPSLILSYSSKTLSPEQISAYVSNVIAPKIFGAGGVSQVTVWGEMKYAMRIWLNPTRMAQQNISTSQVLSALQSQNVQASAGQIKGKYQFINISPQTGLSDQQSFENLVITNNNGHVVRLKNVAQIQLGSESYDSKVTFEGKKGIFAAISPSPTANVLNVAANVRKLLPDLAKRYPPGLQMHLVYDSTKFIRASIDAVIETILEAVIIVLAVIFLFLGALRSVFIPIITIPLSLIGAGLFMLAMGFSINLLTLLALVLAIGLVVDDAIVVLENVYRHIEEGKSRVEAATLGAREIAGPVIVMTLTLAAVYLPIGFMGGLTGSLFTEFAFTLASAVIISGVIALTLTPMLCSKMIGQNVLNSPLVKKIDHIFDSIKAQYEKLLRGSLNCRPISIIVAIGVIICLVAFMLLIPQALAPTEDSGFIGVQALAPAWANLNYLEKYGAQIQKILSTTPGSDSNFAVYGFPTGNNIFGGAILKSWSDRKLTQMQIAPTIQNKLNDIVGLQTFVFQVPGLPGVQAGPQLNFVVASTDSLQKIYPVAQEVMAKAQKTGKFLFLMNDLKFEQPDLKVYINRSKAAALNIPMSTISSALATLTSGGQANYFSKLGYNFKVIPQVSDQNRSERRRIAQYYISTPSGSQIPLSSLVSFKEVNDPIALTQFQQLNAITIQGIPEPGTSLGQAIEVIKNIANQTLPKNMSYGFQGASHQYLETGNALTYAFIFAIIIIFLLLAAQFESFRDPIVILIAVPLTIAGALLPLFFGAATLNIYTKIGLITLIGLICKHGILMVEFANQLQIEKKLPIKEAIAQAAAIRLRPILMTTAAMCAGVFPLILSTGAGAVSRFDLGIIIFSGMLIGTCFTVFVVPTFYTLIAKDRNAPKPQGDLK